MQATFTLATTGFSLPVKTIDTRLILTSTSGVVPGVFLFANRELMRVQYLTGVGNEVVVLRGRDGTETRAHGTGETIYIAQGYQLYEQDPQGLAPLNAFVNPHINVRNGTVWVIQGDDEGGGTQARSWQQVTTTQTIGPLGVRVNTTTTPS